jgi:N-acetylglucosaminyldiphosphoundecaprenol N-acetyl-beta-D-mannosaminyltransferase
MPMIQENLALKQQYILGMKVNVINIEDATRQVIQLAKARKSSYVCLANVHMVMEAYDSAEFRQIVNSADLVTPDGKPLSWSLQALGATNQQQVCGRELTLHICQAAALSRISVGFYGSSKDVLSDLVTKMKQGYPDMNIAYTYSPPFRSLTPQEKDTVIREIQSSGVKILFVGLGCPKQERWMAQHKHQIAAVMLGIGAAFDMLAGAKPQVPRWMQNLGLEWLFRLCLEPRRLWDRNFRHSPRFIVIFARQILKLLLIFAFFPAPALLLNESDIPLDFLQIEKDFVDKNRNFSLLIIRRSNKHKIS